MKDDVQLFLYLKENGASSHGHASGSLFDHLIGTYILLRAWDAPEPVCLAGLFHSVYGTAVYDTKIIPLEKRAELRELIGEGAEYLSYLFSQIDRPLGLIAAFETGEVIYTSTHEKVSLDKETLGALATIEAANLIDQGSAPELAALLFNKSQGSQIALEAKARRALEEYGNV